MIENDYFWNIVLLLALGTLAIRGSIIAISSKVKITERTREIFSFIPAAIFPAIIVPAAFYHPGKVNWLMGQERLAMVLVSTVICYFTKSTLITLVSGLLGLYLLTR